MTTQELWQARTPEAPRVSLEYARHLASEFQDKTLRKRRGEMIMFCLLSALMFSKIFTAHDDSVLMKFFNGWIAVALVIEVFLRHRRVPAGQLPADAGVLGSLQFYRQELERQRDAPKSTVRFSMLVGMPAIVLYVASWVFERGSLPDNWGVFAVGAAVAGVLVVLGAWSRAHEFNREIAAADLLLKES